MTTRPKFTAAQRLKCFEDHGAIVLCQCDDPNCDTAIYIKGCAIDHALALIDGGKHVSENFRPISPGCHAKKSAREHRANSKAKRVAAAQEVHRAVVARVMTRPAGKIKGQGFDKTLRKRVDGTVVRRA